MSDRLNAAETAHTDQFARNNLPPKSEWPDFLLGDAPFDYPAKLNCAVELLDKTCAAGFADKTCFITPNDTWSYERLRKASNRIAHVLVEDLGLIPGNRVMIRAANNPMFMACWFAIAKAGGIVVATMPLLRGKELVVIADRAEIELALCDERLMEEMKNAREASTQLKRICAFNGSGEKGARAELEDRMASKPTEFDAVDTASDDTVLIAFTSGTTGKPKGTMHFHRDVMAICDAFPKSVLKAEENDIFIGSPPLAFTFGLGGLATFPMRIGASSILLEKAPPEELAKAIERFKATICVTAPTAYRALLTLLDRYPMKSLRKCISAGETLPKPTFVAWRENTGIRIIDGIGSTEMLHIFISSSGDDIRPGATGRVIPGYEAKVVDDDMNEVPPGTVGRLAVRGPTGCRYLADPRQRDYVRDGWNLTGDAYLMDEDGYFWFQARADDMIVSAGYNISGPEVEEALMGHDAVSECAVVGAPDEDRGHIVKAFVVLAEDRQPSDALRKELQDYVKKTIAPYKYPRAVDFVPALPRTETGKVQRFRLRQLEEEK